MPWPVDHYTSFAGIRAILGVSDEEVEDETLALDIYEASLDLDLTDIGQPLPALFLTTSEIAPNTRTPTEQRFLHLTANLAALHVARQVGSSLPMLAKTITDGKASMSRFADAPYRLTLDRVEQEYWSTRFALKTAYATLSATSSPVTKIPTLLYGAGAATDRVTNS